MIRALASLTSKSALCLRRIPYVKIGVSLSAHTLVVAVQTALLFAMTSYEQAVR